MPLAPATRLGPYEIVAMLGAGGMGEVYRARDTRLGREIAVKVLPPEVSSAPERLARFEREARAVASLNHPNIVVLHSIEEIAGTHFLTLELVEGRPLADLVTPGGLPPRRLLDLAIPLADALVAAHERGVVHRDLKPANVMVTREDRVKVLDFGIAKITPSASASPVSEAATATLAQPTAGQVLGTVPYMAPEQIRGEPADARTDLFSFGVLFYELATGARPFAGQTSLEIASAILRDSPPPPSCYRSDLPADLERILGRCLEKQPRARFQTALDLLHELRGLRRSLEPAAAPTPAPVSENVASIAVLPFVNRSASAEDEYFSDGLADELLSVLTKIRGLRVAARTSAFRFKGRETTIAEAGRALNVVSILEGSVRKSGQRVRISVQLVKVSDGYHLWSETYERTLDDIFAVQDDIAQSVVKELRGKLLGEPAGADESAEVRAEVERAGRGRGASTEGHRLALQGRHLIERLTREDVSRGMGYLREALRLDPSNAVAWIDLARAHLIHASYGWIPVQEGAAAAREAVGQALAIVPDLPEAHAVLGRIRLYFDWDWEGAAASYRRAMELSPGNAVWIHGAGILAQNEGRMEEALDLYRRAVEQDPLNAGAYQRLGAGYAAAGRLAEAEAALRKSIELAPQRVVVHAHLSRVLLAQGRVDEAREEAERESEEAYRLLGLIAIDRAQGRFEEAHRALRTLVERHADSAAFQIAEAHVMHNDHDRAFEWLERAYAQRDTGLAEIKHAARLAALHGDPRWKAFMRKMGFRE